MTKPKAATKQHVTERMRGSPVEELRRLAERYQGYRGISRDIQMYLRIHEEAERVTKCTFDPIALAGKPIGMFHCPGDEHGPCGCMQLAGIEHGPCDDDCPMQDDADRAALAKMYEQMERESVDEEMAERC